MPRLVTCLALILLSLFATGVVDLDVFVHHEPHGACPESAPEHSETDGHSHAANCCAHHHIALAPGGGPTLAPLVCMKAPPASIGVRAHDLPGDIFRPPRISA